MKPFVFQWPWVLCLLLLLVPLAALLGRARRKRATLCSGFGADGPFGEIGRDWLRLVAVALLILALARPGYSPERRSVSQSGRDVVFAIDVSRSMLAEDAHPSRLEAAKQGVRDALAVFGSERVGLVIYAGSATILCPLTYDHDFVLYMLEQVNPRAVDFGGTTVLSAVEKTVDNVFSDERKGMQDLVVLTDGEDHLPDTGRVAELLSGSGVDLLLIGLGDATADSRIPVENSEGVKSYLKHEEDFVSTRLNEAILKDLAANYEGASYLSPGTAAFDLGGLYLDYALGKPVEGAIGADSFVVYQEAGFLLIGLGFVLFFVSGRVGRALAPAVIAILTLMLQPVRASESSVSLTFDEARDLQLKGRTGEALELYDDLDADRVDAEVLAAVRFNQGLCLIAQAEAEAEGAPGAALSAARTAQACFLEAIRLDPGLSRASWRLDPLALLILGYEKSLAEKEARDQELQEALDVILEKLRQLRADQAELHQQLRDSLPKRGKASPDRKVEPVLPQSADEQARLAMEGAAIQLEMEALEEFIQSQLPEGAPAVESMMKEPIRLMGEAVGAQNEAADGLKERSGWEAASLRQKLAIQRIDQILEILEGGASGDSDDGEGEDEGEWDEEEGDWEEYEDGEEGAPSSMAMDGDLAAGSEMQPLPKPNYSVEDLLMEEQGNQQFREQQRAKAQASKVEKDW